MFEKLYNIDELAQDIIKTDMLVITEDNKLEAKELLSSKFTMLRSSDD